MGLRIEIDDQGIGAASGEQRREVVGGGRLADAPFLIEYRDLRHGVSSPINELSA
jgi:hypothetical protein